MKTGRLLASTAIIGLLFMMAFPASAVSAQSYPCGEALSANPVRSFASIPMPAGIGPASALVVLVSSAALLFVLRERR